MEKILNKVLNYKSKEFKRIYHGRGEKKYKFLTIDSIGDILFIQLYEPTSMEKEIFEIFKTTHHKNVIVKKRYSNQTFPIKGEIPKNAYAIENGLKFKLNFNNLNIGYFGDIKPLREYIKTISKDKTILNLFSYTCGFSMYAKIGKAKEIINIDMNKNVLKIGQINHQINNISTKNVSFLRHNALKSNFKNKLYDIIIIDPPSFQKGGFIIEKDYPKLIKRIKKFTKKDAFLILTLNSPKYEKDFLLEIAKEHKFIKEIKPNKDYTNSTLKITVFKALTN